MPSDLRETIGVEFINQLPDVDPVETQEWQESLDEVIEHVGPTRARYLLAKLLERAQRAGLGVPGPVTTPYVNTIPLEDQPEFPGDGDIERRIRRYIRWNAAVMVTKANHDIKGIGGHLSTFASSATLTGRLQPFFGGAAHPVAATTSTSRSRRPRLLPGASWSAGRRRTSTCSDRR